MRHEGFALIQSTFPGNARCEERPFPTPALLNPATRKNGFTSYADVIAHFTASSLEHDTSVSSKDSLKVEKTASVYSACFQPTKGFAAQSRLFAEMHVAIHGRSVRDVGFHPKASK